MAADIGNTTWRVYLYCTRQIYAVHAESALKSIHVPVLLVHGQTRFDLSTSTTPATWRHRCHTLASS